MVRATGGFTHSTLVEWSNYAFNLTENVLTLVVGGVTADLTEFVNIKDIIDALDPVA